MPTMYDILNMKAKNSIMKSFFVKPFHNDSHANVRIEFEPYDDTGLNAIEKNEGLDYILESLEKKLTKKSVREKIMTHLNLDDEEFKGALTTVYGGMRVHELYFMENGVNQYDYVKQKNLMKA